METIVILVVAVISGGSFLAFNKPAAWRRLGEKAIGLWAVTAYITGALTGVHLAIELPSAAAPLRTVLIGLSSGGVVLLLLYITLDWLSRDDGDAK